MFGEGEIRMTEKFRRDRRLLRSIDNFGFQAREPNGRSLELGARSREFCGICNDNVALHRGRSFHRAVKLIEPIGSGGEGESGSFGGCRTLQRMNRRRDERNNYGEKD